MFTSKRVLTESLGVDLDIAAFFVDRKVPVENHYWKGRLLYVAKGTGYLFIPLFIDIQLKCGIKKEVLLNEEYIVLMEKILDHAGGHEFGHVAFDEHIRQIDELVAARTVQPWLLQNLRAYFKNQPLKPQGVLGLDNAALNRGDALLYLLTVLETDESTIRKIIGYWYQLVPSFLLLDDIMDIHEDKENKEENSLSALGFNANGVRKAIAILEENFSGLETINPPLSNFFRELLERKKQSDYLLNLLNDK